MKVKTLVLRGLGINADQELASAFSHAGSITETIHVLDLCRDGSRIEEFHIIAFPGGFSYGDHLGSGQILAAKVRSSLEAAFFRHISQGRLVLGICNGFQTITKLGLVPRLGDDFRPDVSLVHNIQGRFINKWVNLRVSPGTTSPWLLGMDAFRLPIRHGEGRLVFRDSIVEQRAMETGRAVLFYEGENPNGSSHAIAGMCDASGRVLGMMPHPEAFISRDQDPAFKRGVEDSSGQSAGMLIFANAVNYCRANL